MKSKYFNILFLCFALFSFVSCEEDDRDLNFIDAVSEPTNISLLVQLTQDNSGMVTFTPSGESVSLFRLNYGDGSEVEEVQPGDIATHVYPEGNYSVEVTGVNIIGETTTVVQEVVVSFLPPENLMINVSPVSGDAFSIAVSATADFAVGFEVYFGDQANETPTPLMVGETITHTYPETGVYTLRVVAFAGGAATIEDTMEVVIENPIVLPIDFESTTIEYSFIDFGGAATSVAANPDPSGENTSDNVAELFKEVGAEVWAGTVIELGAPIDFTTFQGFSLKSYSPQAGVTIKLKIENANDNMIAAEVDAVTTVTDEWETLFFDFTGTDFTQEYSKIIVFYDFGNIGTGATYYFDDIEQSNGFGGGNEVSLPVDFENSELTYTVFGFEGADSTIEANPVPSGINTSATVVRTEKTVGAQFFAGTIVELDVPIDFTTSEMVRVKTYSPKADIPVRLKLESPDGSQFVELDVNTTVTDEWEVLTWDFTGTTLNNTYTKVVIFFEFVPALAGDGSVYYFDDIELAN
ncbi:MAG: hypothetical protein HKM28_00350 [Flavobacteriaceae bacterium]|nr:hypothetical protein [Flavobacteriaceae bacterium]